MDDWGSRSATHLGGAQNGAAAFATTHWSVVLEAQSQSPAAQEALEKLCRTYWRPVYSFIRRQGAGPEEAEDLTQGFFALLLERRDLETVRKEKGRLRSYLLVSLKHFQTSGTTSTLLGVSFTDTNNGTAVGEFGTILRTTDGGNNWAPQVSGTVEDLWGVSFTDANNGTAVGFDFNTVTGLILRTI